MPWLVAGASVFAIVVRITRIAVVEAADQEFMLQALAVWGAVLVVGLSVIAGLLVVAKDPRIRARGRIGRRAGVPLPLARGAR